MKKFLSLFVALAMVFSVFAGVGTHAAKAATALTVTVVAGTETAAGTPVAHVSWTAGTANYTLVRTGDGTTVTVGGLTTTSYDDATVKYGIKYTYTVTDAAAATGSATYKPAVTVVTMGQTFTGTVTVSGAAQTITLVRDDGTTVVDQTTVAPGDTTYTLNTYLGYDEGLYEVLNNGAFIRDVYLQYVFSYPTTSKTLAAGLTYVTFSGKFSRGSGSNGYGKAYLVGPDNTVWAVSTAAGYTDYSFTNGARALVAGDYKVVVGDGYSTHLPGDPDPGQGLALGATLYPSSYSVYYTWTVAPLALTVTPVVEPTLLYNDGTLQNAFIYVTDSTGAAISGCTITNASGVTGMATVADLGNGFYKISGIPATAGIANYSVVNGSQQASFTLTIQPANTTWMPRVSDIQIGANGMTIGSTFGFTVSSNVGTSYNFHDSYFTVTGPYATDLDTEETYYGAAASQPSYAVNHTIAAGGQFAIDFKALLWTTASALTCKTREVDQAFKINPTVVGDSVTVSPASFNVGDTGDITVTVKQPSQLERNNGMVVLEGISGQFTIPSGASYQSYDDGVNQYLVFDAINMNKNIIGGVYTFNNVTFNHAGTVSVSTYKGSPFTAPAGFPSAASLSGLATLTGTGSITVARRLHTLTCDVAQFVAGQIYPTVNISGGITGLTFNTPYSIDKGDGSYVFSFGTGVTGNISDTSYRFRADYGTDDRYQVIVPVVMPTLKFTSVHADGLITDSFAEAVKFTLTDPVTGAYMTPSTVEFVEQYNTWGVSGNENQQVSQVLSQASTIALDYNKIVTTATTGNPYVDYTVDKPNITLGAVINGSDEIYFADALTVTAPSITFTVTGMGDKVQLYVGQSNTITATALDAHKGALSNAYVALVGSTSGSWSTNTVASYDWTAGGITGTDGSTTFSAVPTYIGNYKLLLAMSDGGAAINTDPVTGDPGQYVASVSAPADTTAPTITITSGIDGSTVTSDTLTLTGTVTDNVKVAAVYVGVNKVDLLPDGSFQTAVKLAAGDNTITVTAYDAAGNKATATAKVTFTAPKTGTVIVLTIGTDIVTVNGKATSVAAAPEIVNGRTFVPLRFIAETFGADVEWLAETQGITITLGDDTIGLQIGNATAVINGNITALDAAPYIKNSSTMVPLRVISESFGGNVAWDPALRTITITYVQP